MIIIKRQTDLTRLCRVENMAGVTFTGEQDGHKFIIEAMRDNERVELSGSVTGRFIRPDGVSVALTASEDYAGIDDDGMAWVVLAANCYTVAGPFGLVVTHIESGKRTVIFSCTGYVRPGETSEVVDPENIINIDAIMGIIDDMQNALTASTIATAAANAAATGAVANFAGAYAANTAYSAGNYVTYNGGMYKITADITATNNTAWVDVSKTQVTAGSEIEAERAALETFMAGEKEIPIPIGEVQSNYVSYSNGKISGNTSSAFGHVGYIPVAGYSKIKYGRISSTGSADSYGLAFYKGTGGISDFISGSGVKCLKNQTTAGYVLHEVDVPANATHIAVSVFLDTNTYGNMPLYGVVANQVLDDIDDLQTDVAALQDDVEDLQDEVIIRTELTGWTDTTDKKYASPSNKDATGWTDVQIRTADSAQNQYVKWPVKAGDTILIGSANNGNYIRAYLFENAEGKTKPSDTAWCSASSPSSVSNLTVTAPDGAKYIYISRTYAQDVAGSYYVRAIKKYVDESIADHLPNDGLRIVSFGDSIFGNYRANFGPNESISHMVSVLTGMECINAAFGGTHGHESSGRGPVDFPGLAHAIVSGTWTDQEAYAASKGGDYPARVQALEDLDFSTVDIVTVSYGTNDWSYGTSKANFKTGLLDGIDTLAAAYPNLRFLLCTPIIRFMESDGDPSEEAEDEDDSDTPSGTIVDSDNDLMKNASSQLKISDFAEAVQEVGTARHLPVCENYWSLAVNLANRETYFGNSMVHPNADGRRLIAHHVADALNRM